MAGMSPSDKIVSEFYWCGVDWPDFITFIVPFYYEVDPLILLGPYAITQVSLRINLPLSAGSSSFLRLSICPWESVGYIPGDFGIAVSVYVFPGWNIRVHFGGERTARSPDPDG